MQIKDKHKYYLVGMAGAGKSTIGLGAAVKLKMSFFDMDTEVVKRAGKSISKIIKEQGEEKFRDLEKETLEDLITQKGTALIATGGGTPVYKNNMQKLKESGTVIWLHTPIDVLIDRLKESSDDRPLIKAALDDKFVENVKNMYNSRLPFYEQADIKIENVGYDDEIIDHLIHVIKDSNHTPE